jgi:TetR/AcrR family transcriptional regulator, transcriptional repressor for nem operon
MAAGAHDLPPRSREIAKQETREALLAAAMAEFAEKGLDVPSLDSICARAGFTRGAFYVHFRDRDELVAAVMERVVGLLLEAVIGGEGGAGDLAASVERYAALAAHGLDDLGRGSSGRDAPAAPGLSSAVPFHQVLAACQRSDGTRARMVSVLRRAGARLAELAAADQRAGRVRAGVPPAELASLLVLLALGVRAAADLRLPLDVARTRDAALRLLAPER